MDLTILKKLIAGSYGTADLEFAGHDLDIERARKSLSEAAQQNIGYEEYLEIHREYLKGRGANEAHIDEQLEEVQKLSNYFSLD